MHRKRVTTTASLLVLASLLLTACPAPAEPATVVVTAPPQVVTATPPAPAPPTPAGPKTLVICLGQEPDTLYFYGSGMLAAAHIWQSVYDGGVAWGGGDNRTFDFQPVILEKLPNIDDGDAVINAVAAGEGDKVVNDAGDVVELAAGETIRPAGCLSGDCAVTYEGGEVEMDQFAVTFKMLPGLTWSDGEPVTADDSVYSYELVGDPDTPTSRFLYDRTASYEAADDVTAMWTSVPGFIDATYFVNFWTPLPRHLWQEQLGYSAADLVTAEESSRTPLGWGPFVIKEWVAGDHITVEKNPNYFRASEGLPKVDTIVFRFTGEDPNPVIAGALAGECDIIDQSSGLESQGQLLIELEAAGQLVPTFVTGTSWEHVDFGVNVVDSYERPDFFEDVRLRQAFAQCLGRQEVVDGVFFGRTVVIHSFTAPDHPMYAGDLKQWPDDPAAGMALLDEIGWVDDDGDPATPRVAQGVEGIPDGTPLSFKWQSTTAEFRRAYMPVYQQNLAECGIEVILENLAAGQYFADGPEGPIFGRAFDVGSFAWLTGVVPSCDLYISDQIPTEDNGWGGQNNTGWSNAEYDAVCKEALGTLFGTDEYVEAIQQTQRLFAEQLPVVPLFLRLKLAAYRPEVTGFIMDPTENSEMWNIESFDLQ